MSDQQLATEEQTAQVEAGVDISDAPTVETTPAADNSSSSADTPDVSTDTNKTEEEVGSILDLQIGQKMDGKVKNITDFGAFVDIGLPQDGLVHISELSRKKVEKVTDVVSVGQDIEVWVKKVDQKRGRISLTMVKPISLRIRDIEEGAELEGVVTRLESYGAFVDIDSERDGLVHISQITHEYIDTPGDALSVGDSVNVKVLKVNKKKRQIDLSIKALVEPPAKEQPKEEKFEPEPVVQTEIEEVNDEPVPTAMAMAYAAMQSKLQDDRSDGHGNSSKEVSRRRQMDDIVARTLATNNK
ncbi:MAG: S1 RNA-binding domain-containing protein [Anaerolineae bacterium]|nr:S1 RNA-binding domain-containing protein [Anaerolineae bacterium]